MNGLDFTQLGVSGLLAAVLFALLVVLWKDNQALRKQAREDQAAVLPALTTATAAMTEFARASATLQATVVQLVQERGRT